jgi:hypothetical protein
MTLGRLSLTQLLFFFAVVLILWSLFGSHDGRFRGRTMDGLVGIPDRHEVLAA